LLNISEANGSITFSVRVIPRSSKTEIVGDHDGALKIKLKAPPVDDAANEELIRFLSETLNTPRSTVEIISGQTSRTKRLRITGLLTSDFDRFLRDKS
jgi:uncharacterized protein (TIGR00251 family)